MPQQKIQITEIEPIEDDIKDILKSIEKLENNFKELKEINTEMINIIGQYLFKPPIKDAERPTRKGWLFN